MKLAVKHKQPILAMALSRGLAEERIESRRPTIEEHIAKLVLYSDSRPQDVHGWCRTVARSFSVISDIVIKPKNKRFDYDQYVYMILGGFGEDRHDIRNLLEVEELTLSTLRQDPYEEVDITQGHVELCEQYYNVMLDFCEMLQDTKEKIPLETFLEILKSVK